MSRRPSLPGAAELFRATTNLPGPGSAPSPPTSTRDSAQERPSEPVGAGAQVGLAAVGSTQDTEQNTRRVTRRRVPANGARRPSGRQRHEEKITVYCSAEELLDLESARLTLRGEHGLVVDRGRIVREAVAVVLADLESKGEESVLVRRLRES